MAFLRPSGAGLRLMKGTCARSLSLTDDRAIADCLRAELRQRHLLPPLDWNRQREVLRRLDRHLDAAVDDLDLAERLAPDDTALLSDLTAAYLGWAGERNNVEADIAVLGAAQLDLAQRPASEDARLTQLVAMESVEIDSQVTFRLTRDPESPRQALERLSWLQRAVHGRSAEALRLRARLLRAMVRFFPAFPGAEIARAFLEGDLLPAWAAAMEGDPSMPADEILLRCRLAAAALAARGADPALVDIVAEMKQAAALPPGAEARETFVRALAQLASGREHLRQHDNRRAMSDLTAAERGFSRRHSPAVLLTRHLRAVCLFQQGDDRPARTLLRALARDPLLARFPTLDRRGRHLLRLIAQRAAEAPAQGAGIAPPDQADETLPAGPPGPRPARVLYERLNEAVMESLAANRLDLAVQLQTALARCSRPWVACSGRSDPPHGPPLQALVTRTAGRGSENLVILIVGVKLSLRRSGRPGFADAIAAPDRPL